jgi:hypothetical protein
MTRVYDGEDYNENEGNTQEIFSILYLFLGPSSRILRAIISWPIIASTKYMMSIDTFFH